MSDKPVFEIRSLVFGEADFPRADEIAERIARLARRPPEDENSAAPVLA